MAGKLLEVNAWLRMLVRRGTAVGRGSMMLDRARVASLVEAAPPAVPR